MACTTVAALELNLSPRPLNLCVTRRDSFPFAFGFTQDGAPLDFTGSTFLFTVNGAADGSGAAIFAIGESNTPGVDGVVEFTPSIANLTQVPATYYFDLQWTDTSGNVRTLLKGEFNIGPDISA